MLPSARALVWLWACQANAPCRDRHPWPVRRSPWAGPQGLLDRSSDWCPSVPYGAFRSPPPVLVRHTHRSPHCPFPACGPVVTGASATPNASSLHTDTVRVRPWRPPQPPVLDVTPLEPRLSGVTLHLALCDGLVSVLQPFVLWPVSQAEHASFIRATSVWLLHAGRRGAAYLLAVVSRPPHMPQTTLSLHKLSYSAVLAPGFQVMSSEHRLYVYT